MREKLTRNIVIAVMTFLIAQVVLFLIVTLSYGLGLGRYWAFFPITIIWHVGTLAFLIQQREGFFVESSGERLERVNLANVLTLVRISTLPTILFFIFATREKPLFPLVLWLTALVFLTDFLDGFVSRTFHQGTKIGRMLDSISDYVLLGSLSIVFLFFKLIHLWFLGLIIFRLAFQAVGMFIFILRKRPVDPRPTLLGKIVVASTMILYAFSIFKPIAPKSVGLVFDALEAITAVIIVASVVDKALVFARHKAKKAATK
jgi:CDP-diacylglycerol--glycerol-3-phosphate 3-phosphatidyltransferase